MQAFTILVFYPLTAAYTMGYSRHAFYDHAFHSTDKHQIYSDFFDETGMALKTKQVQRSIFKHQNPLDCSQAKFIATRGFNTGGLGAEMVGIASHLSWALTNNYVLVWDRAIKSKYFNASAECMDKGYSCIFQPLSRCETYINRPLEHINEIFNIFLIPPQFEAYLHKYASKISHAQALYWWKAQSVGYVMRINDRALDSIIALRKNQSSHNATKDQRIPFPLPGGSVNMHIRRGNKIHEMDYIDASVYVHGYTRLVASEPMGFAQRWVYISSDSLLPIWEAKSILEGHEGHTVVAAYSLMPRLQGGFCHDAWHHFPSNSTEGTILLLMELLMALECDAWIGTRISTWGRMIDLLRCVWTDKCKHPFVEIGSLHQDGQGNQHMYHEFVVPRHATPYGKQQTIWQAPSSYFSKH